MAEHRLEERDPGNTSDPNEALTEELHPDELAEILRRFDAGEGVLHTSPRWSGSPADPDPGGAA
jgi:hypothetical protein